MKYESEILYDLMKRDGLLNPSQNNLPYESELKEEYIDSVKGAYPKLTDYQAEWLNYAYNKQPIGEFPYVALSDVTNATIENVVPYAYKSAILNGKTKFINEYGVEQADKTIFHSCYFEQGTIGGSIGAVIAKENSPSRIRLINPLSLEIGSHSISVISGYEVYVKIINSANIGIRQGGFNSSIKFDITDSSKEKVYIVFRKSDNANITPDEVEGIISSSTIPELTSLVSVQMPVLTTSNEDGTKSNILTVNEDVTLRGIGEVKDTLDCLTGELTQRIGEVVFDGSDDEDWGVANEGDTINGFSIWKNIANAHHNGLVCDKLSYFDYSDLNDKTQFISCINQTQVIVVNIKGLTSADGVKQWLSENPITVQYQLATESIKTVELTITNQNGESLSKMSPIEGTMNLTTSSDTIAPTFSGEIPVEAIEQNLESFIGE